MLFVYYIIFFFLFTVILRPFTTLIHELGHGIPALLYTNNKVTLYLGSYGDPKESFKVAFGRLVLFFNKKPFNWNIGLCVREEHIPSINKHIIVVLMGPLASLALSLVLSYFIFFIDLNEHILVILALFNISTYYDFFINIVPNNKPIKLHNGSLVYNDGKQILDLMKFKNVYEEYNIGVVYYTNKDYKLAVSSFEKVIKKGYDKPIIYQFLVSAYLLIKDNENALRVNNLYTSKFNEALNSNDYANMGLIKSFSGAYEKAIKDYNKAIELNLNNSIAYNNRGYTYNLLENYEEAIKDFEKAITLEKSFAYALNNRGFARIKLGLKKDGLKDLEDSMAMDGTNSYCYMNFGIYYYDNQDYKKALEYFIKAKELDSTTYLLNDYLQNAKEKLEL